MKRILTLLAATAVVGASQAQIAWRDMRVEGQWHAVSLDGSGSEAWLTFYANGRFVAEVDLAEVGTMWAAGNYTIRIGNGYWPAETVNLTVDQWQTTGRATAPNQHVQLTLLDGNPPMLTNGRGARYYPVGSWYSQPTVWSPAAWSNRK